MKKRILTINEKKYLAYSGFLDDVNYYIISKQYSSINANGLGHLEICGYNRKTIGWEHIANIKITDYHYRFKSYAALQEYLSDNPLKD